MMTITWLVCMQCGTKEALTDATKFDGGCLNCGGGPRTAQDEQGRPVVLMSEAMDVTSWDVQEATK